MSEISHDEVLRLHGIRKSYNVGQAAEAEVLHGIDLELGRDDFAALIGPSGSGKSTLLNLLGLLDHPTAGELYLLGQATSALDDAALTGLRARSIGFVFQFLYLIEVFTALENVLMPWMVTQGRPDSETVDWAISLLQAVGLADFTGRKPSEL
ncbi:MAG: ATP-binding cassette domain-containing protein, partial [Halioglobus sp.]|nr:ATP-binding cassette domain-containing protein [Halioglobus sp.]